MGGRQQQGASNQQVMFVNHSLLVPPHWGWSRPSLGASGLNGGQLTPQEC